jgi:hypothetical protein
MAALLGLMSLGMVLRNLIKGLRVRQGSKAFEGIRWWKLILVLCTLVGYGIAFETFGFGICTFLLMVLLLGVIGRKKGWITLAVSLIIAISSYLIFVVLLGAEFPKGFLGI